MYVRYRTLVKRSDEWDQQEKAKALKTIWVCAGGAIVVALLVILAVAIPLAALGSQLDNTAAEVIEGVSKVVAAICILQLSLKVPKWLSVGPYARLQSQKSLGFSERELKFNVSWNIWREVAEIGVFLIPFFLSGDLSPIPLSALVGIAIALVPGVIIYVVNTYTAKKAALAATMAVITGWLACGLFTGGMHEFEEVLGETPDVFWMPGCKSSSSPTCTFWHHKKFPCALIKPFGYSHSPTVLQMASFWSFVAVLILAHALKWRVASKKADKGATANVQVTSKEQEADRVSAAAAQAI